MSDDRCTELPRVQITAAICAHNDAAVLRDAVASVMKQTLPGSNYEVLVIDNASTDGTGCVGADLQVIYGKRLKVYREQRLGLSHARNRALSEASAPIVAFIDADAVADPGWLEAMVEAFEHCDRAGVVGGPVRIQWDQPRPRWWDDRLGEALNAYRPGDEPMSLGYPRYPYGTNFALRADSAEAVGGFRAGLGRRGHDLTAGEESEICLRFQRAGWEIRFTPHAMVHHRTAADRLHRRYILRRAWNHGRSQFLVEFMHGFESGRYLSWAGILGRITTNLLRLRCDLPFAKFILFRVGYQYQRTLARLRGVRSGTLAQPSPGNDAKRGWRCQAVASVEEPAR